MRRNSSPKKVCLVSLGCPKNLVDSEMMLGSLKQDGFELTICPEEAEVLVVNTCSFVEDSKVESIDHLLEMAEFKEKGRCEVLVSVGCLSQRYGDALVKDMPEVDLIIGTGEFDRLPTLLKEFFAKNQKGSFLSDRQILPDPEAPRILSTPPHYSYLKVSEGCSHRCSFCVIPDIRGVLKSRPIDSIVREVERLVEGGVKEFNLIAQDLNEYGRDLKDGSTLAELLVRLNEIPGKFWLRPLYMYPLLFNDRLIEVLRDSEHVVKYIDIPLQHINEKVLRSMKRGSSDRYIRQLLSKIKREIPECTLRTTFIVGYPGETEEQFQELCDFVKEFQFDHVGTFQYSQEEGTEAGDFSDQIPKEIKSERQDRLMTLQREISLKKNRALIGKRVELLVDGPSEESELVFHGRLLSQAPEIDGVTYLSRGIPRPGQFVSATIIEARAYDLVASME